MPTSGVKSVWRRLDLPRGKRGELNFFGRVLSNCWITSVQAKVTRIAPLLTAAGPSTPPISTIEEAARGPWYNLFSAQAQAVPPASWPESDSERLETVPGWSWPRELLVRGSRECGAAAPRFLFAYPQKAPGSSLARKNFLNLQCAAQLWDAVTKTPVWIVEPGRRP